MFCSPIHPDLRPQPVKTNRIKNERHRVILDALGEVQTVLSKDGAARAKVYLTEKVNELTAA